MSSMPRASYHTAAECPARENYTGPYDPEPRYLHGPCGLRTTDIRAFLLDMLSMDESAALGARATTDGHWNDASPIPNDVSLYSASGKLTVGQHRHIARHDPARVLAEVDAKRRIIEQHHCSGVTCPRCSLGTEDGEVVFERDPCGTLRLLALPYAGHPDYRGEWAPHVEVPRVRWRL
jgi:hypothetical protein